MLAAALALLLQMPTCHSAGNAEHNLFSDLNRARVVDGLRPLEWDPLLSYLAREHAEDMARRAYYSHVSPEGLTPFDRMENMGEQFEYAGENIAAGEDERDAESALIASPDHRDNMLDLHYDRVGVGVAIAPDGTMLFVEDFTD